MVRKDLAEEMGLEGTSIKIVITKVGGAEEELDTKMYKVPVTTYQGKKVQVVQAVGISHISDDVTNVNLSESIGTKIWSYRFVDWYQSSPISCL